MAILLGLVFFLAGPAVRAQEAHQGKTIICFGNDFTFDATVRPPSYFLEGGAETLSDFVITYQDVPALARRAIDYAAAIWENTLFSEVPIRVEVTWDSLGENALAAAGPTTFYRDFPGDLSPRIWYPVPLAEAIVGEDLNDTLQPDIVVTVNREANWYYGRDAQPPLNTFDLVSVILHEFGHGLGFFSSAREDEAVPGQAELGFDGFLVIFDYFLENGMDQALRDTSLFPSPSSALFTQLTNNNVFFDSPGAAAFNGGRNPKLFAPTDFDEGSSISHLDEFTYRSGQRQALMTPRIARAEAIHHPGEMTIAMMERIGWMTVLSRNSTGVARVEELPLRVFPNPTAGSVSLDLPEAARRDRLLLRVTDPTGRVLLSRLLESVSTATLEFDLPFPPGAYLVSLEGERFLLRSRVVRM